MQQLKRQQQGNQEQWRQQHHHAQQRDQLQPRGPTLSGAARREGNNSRQQRVSTSATGVLTAAGAPRYWGTAHSRDNPLEHSHLFVVLFGLFHRSMIADPVAEHCLCNLLTQLGHHPRSSHAHCSLHGGWSRSQLHVSLASG